MMKYFTREWHLAIQDFDMPSKDINRPIKEYKRYYKSIKNQLPKQFVAFDKSYSLHDATLRRLNLNAKKQQLKIKLMLAIVHETFIEGRNGTVIYTGVTDFSSSTHTKNLIAGSDSYGFLLFNEIEVISSGVFEHRILFSSGVEFSITFTDFEYSIAT